MRPVVGIEVKFERSGLLSSRDQLKKFTIGFLTELLALTQSGGSGVSVIYCSPKKIQTLKKHYLGIDEVTDVLSFPTGDIEHLGDIAICLPFCRDQARDRGVTAEAEVALMLTHGLLHLLGYDHDTAANRKKMWKIQEHLLRSTKNLSMPRLVVSQR